MSTKPCPRCSANLLTEPDWLAYKLINAAIDVINCEAGEIPADAEVATLRFKTQGDGLAGLTCEEL